MKETILIRAETANDRAWVWRVNELAFGGQDEADLVDALRENARPYISLVAIVDDELVGHIFFSPAALLWRVFF